MDTNGIPAISSALPTAGPFSTKSGQDRLLQLTGPTQASIGQLVQTIVEMVEGPAGIITDTVRRKVSGGDYDPLVDKWQTNLAADASYKKLTLVPTTGQEGRSLVWEVSGSPPVGFHAATLAAIQGLIAPVTPKFTVGQLVQRLASALPDGAHAQILVDQDTGKVEFYQYANGQIGSSVNLVEIEEIGGVSVSLTEPAEEGVSPKKFEGGSF